MIELNAAHIAVDGYHDGYGHCCLGRRDGDGEQGEEVALLARRIEQTIEEDWDKAVKKYESISRV